MWSTCSVRGEVTDCSHFRLPARLSVTETSENIAVTFVAGLPDTLLFGIRELTAKEIIEIIAGRHHSALRTTVGEQMADRSALPLLTGKRKSQLYHVPLNCFTISVNH